MKKLLTALLLVFISFSVFAEAQKIITVMDFETSGVSKQEMTLFVDYLSSSVSDYDGYKLIDRRQREIILAEAEFSNSGCAEESCAVEIGQLLSASEMIVGSLGSIGSFYLLNIKLIDVETGETKNDVSKRYNSIDELIIDCETVLDSLFTNERKIVEMPQPPIQESRGPESNVSEKANSDSNDLRLPLDFSATDEPEVITSDEIQKQNKEKDEDLVRKGGAIEISYGWNSFLEDSGWNNLPNGEGLFMHNFIFRYLYQFNNSISLGGGAGVTIDIRNEGDYNGGTYILPTITAIFGNKVDSFAFSADIILFTAEHFELFNGTIGVYFKNFFIKLSPMILITMASEDWLTQSYFELGYSFYFGE